jgi:hypothetical protein
MNNLISKIVLLWVLVTSVGCAPVMSAGWDMESSKDKYKQCLESNANNP